MTLTAAPVLALQAALPANQPAPLLQEAVAVASVQLAHADELGKLRSAVVGDGEIRFPDYPDLKPRPVKAGDRVSPEGLARFSIAEVALAPDGASLRVRMAGRVDHLRVSAGGQQRDESLSAFEQLVHSRSLALRSAVTGWVLATTLAAYRLFKELK